MRVVHKLNFTIPSKFATTRCYIKCRYEPVGIYSNLIFVESSELVTCKHCLKILKKETGKFKGKNNGRKRS